MKKEALFLKIYQAETLFPLLFERSYYTQGRKGLKRPFYKRK